MDGDRFDSITRRLASGTTRREVLRKLGGSVIGGTLAVTGLRRSGAAPKGKVGICHRTGSASNPFVYIEVSQNAVPAHQAHGDAVGVDLQTDPNNCGTCGNVCGGDACNTPVCQNGQCGTTAVVCPDDGDPCTTNHRCDVNTGACVSDPVVCPDDGNPCTDEICVAGRGCERTFNTNPCTTEDGAPGTCASGVCEEDDPGNQPCETFVCGNPPCAVRGPGTLDICACFELTEQPGEGLCLGNFFCGSTPSCQTSADCPDSFTCVTNTCCGLGVQFCAPPCPEEPEESGEFSVNNVDEGGPSAPNAAGV